MQVVPASEFEPKDYPLIGKLVAINQPKTAKDLLEAYHAARNRALDDDLIRINYYYLHYCNLFGLNPLQILGTLYDRTLIDQRRLFIGSMVRMYKPQLLTHAIQSKTGLTETLSRVLNFDAGNLSKTMEQVIAWMKSDFDGFRTNAEEVAERLLNIRQGYGSADLFKSA